MTKKIYQLLSIAGFDGSGGAGIQSDIKTFSALGGYAFTVLTAIPIQNSQGVTSIYPLSEECIHEQLHSIFDDSSLDGVKIGMLHRKEVIQTSVKFLEKKKQKHVILDPVIMPKNGVNLLNLDALEILKQQLFPFVTILTPNLPEASLLLGREINTKWEMEQAARDLAKMGPQAVVIKGGHLSGKNCEDCLCIRNHDPEITWFSAPRIDTKNTHGTGCVFSAALTVFLAEGKEIAESVKEAKNYVWKCLERSVQFPIGKGCGPLDHFLSQASNPPSNEKTF